MIHARAIDDADFVKLDDQAAAQHLIEIPLIGIEGMNATQLIEYFFNKTTLFAQRFT